MDKELKQYLDDRFGQVKDQIESVSRSVDTLATATGQHFQSLEKRMDQRFDEVDKELRTIKERLSTVETNTEMLSRGQREIRERLEKKIEPRLSNLEAQVG